VKLENVARVLTMSQQPGHEVASLVLGVKTMGSSTEPAALSLAQAALASAVYSPVHPLLSVRIPRVSSVELSDDGTRIFATTYDGGIYVVDATSGQVIRREVQKGWSATAFSPDGRLLLMKSKDRAEIRDVSSGSVVNVLALDAAKLTKARFSPDSRSIVAALGGGIVSFWDVSSVKQQWVTELGGEMKVASFSPDGERLIIAAADKAASVLDTKTGARHCVINADAPISSFSFSQWGNLVGIGTSDGGAIILESSCGQVVRRVAAIDGVPVDSLGFTRGGDRVLLAGPDGGTRLLVNDTIVEVGLRGSEKERFQRGFELPSAVLSPDGRKLLTASWDHTVTVWDPAQARPLGKLVGHEGDIMSFAFSRRSDLIATAASDSTVRIWALSFDRVPTRLLDQATEINVAQFSPDGRRIISASRDGAVTVWAWDGASYVVERTMPHGSSVEKISLSSDGKLLLTGSQEVILWDLHKGSATRIWQQSSTAEYLTDVSLAPKGDGAVITTTTKAVVWDAASQRLRNIASPLGPVASDYSPNGANIVISGLVGGVVVLTAHSQVAVHKKLLSGFDPPGCTSTSFSPGGNRILIGCVDGFSRIVDLKLNTLVTLTGHSGQVTDSVYSWDGEWIATGARDQSIRIWDALDGKPLFSIVGIVGTARSVSFSVDRKWLLVVADDGTVRSFPMSGAPLLSAACRLLKYRPEYSEVADICRTVDSRAN
jgi:YD repeat-containing protein